MKEALQRNDREKREQNAADELDMDLELSSDTEAPGINGSSALAAIKLSSKKKEALSQVPCKFFRSNGCSAGSSCPFAHIGPGEGQGKAICQWFLKGSCRFGHKCALAHILPGQPMSMDRKNKRAAHHQQQQQGLGSVSQGQGQQMSQHRVNQDQQQYHSGQSSLYHSSSSRGFEIINLEDPSRSFMTVFGNQQHREGDLLFGVPDDLQATNSHAGIVLPSQLQATFGTYRPEWKGQSVTEQREEVDIYARHKSSFEVITQNIPMSTQAFGTSPFSHPGSHSVFFSNDTMASNGKDTSQARPQASFLPKDDWLRGENEGLREGYNNTDCADANDINEEDFLPSSLSDLLTPAELHRRSRGGLLVGQNSSQALTPQSLPARTSDNISPWNTSYPQRHIHSQNLLSSDVEGEDLSLTNARDKLANSIAATSPLPPPSYLHPGQSHFGVSNTSAGFLTSRLRRGLSTAQMEDDIRGSTKARPLDAYSPGAHAAMSHAPGQSLPQGLASGLSSLHLRSDDNKGIQSGNVAEQRQGVSLFTPTSSNNYHNEGMMEAHFRGNDDLGPTAPSSIISQRTPLHFNVARSMGMGHGSASTSLENLHHATSTPLSMGMKGTGHVFSPYAQSPAHRVEGGIAIPSNSGEAFNSANSSSNSNNGIANSESHQQHHHVIYSNSSSSNNNKSLHSHLSKNRVRNAGNTAGSPLTLPTTGEEVEEAIFELE